MWGGLAMAYFSPVKRAGDLALGASGRRAFQRALAEASRTK
jgi:hypothetical protein